MATPAQFPAHSGGAIIVTPEGHADFPAALRMTPDEYLDWLAALNVSLGLPTARPVRAA